MNTLQQAALALEGGTMAYEIGGIGETVVLSHAGFLDSRMFDAQWDELTVQFRVIRYDMIGFGRSSAATGPACRRDDLRRLLDHLQVERAHFLGCSMGGEVILDLALEQPERALSLTLVGATPSGFGLQGVPPRDVLALFEALGQGDAERAGELQLRIWLDGEMREPEAIDPTLRQKALTMTRIPAAQGTMLIADAQPLNPLNLPAVKRLHEIRCPTWVVVGSLDHPEVRRAADVLADGIPNARRAVIEGAGHVPSFERPDDFNPLLLGFLNGK
jgi:pimeloyl-ACP methyl ester carboxylesterase